MRIPEILRGWGMEVAADVQSFERIEDWQDYVGFYAEDLRLLSDLGISVRARHILARLADAHGLMPTQLVALLLNQYLEGPLAAEQVVASEQVWVQRRGV